MRAANQHDCANYLAARPEETQAGRRQRGFTLLEMVVTITLLGTLAAVGSQILASGVQAFDASQQATTTLAKANYVTERLGREVRNIQYSGTSYTISAMTSTRFAFTKQDLETVDLRYTSPNLTLAYGSVVVTPVLSDQVTAATFTYYQSDGVTTTTSASMVAYVDFQLTWSDGSTQYSRQVRVGLREQPW